ncbi:MAG: septal ring lytic transglycosylase RlpA family protein [Treponema sp.]|jgi:rare lipoprotein A|nr:septal ring lytic transglycosylase RlpA family protein [Treponema sp.]
MKRKNALIFTLLYISIHCIPRYAMAQSYSVSMGEIYKEEGIASWYGPDFDGRPTASGEFFNSSLYTAAHPTLPFGTFVLVTNKQNNRQVTVKVNDRGPFVAGRIIDLSKKAAEHLDMINAGTVPVIIETLPGLYLQAPPTAQPDRPEPVAEPKPAPVIQPEPAPPAEIPYQLPPIIVNVYTPPPAQSDKPEPLVEPAPQAPPPIQAQPAPYPPEYYYPPPPVQPAPYPPEYYYPPPQTPPPVQPAYPPPEYYYPPPQTPPPVQPAYPPPAQTPPVYEPLPPVNTGFKLSPSINPSPNKTYKLQIGSFKIPRNAVEAFDKLKAAGLNPAYEQNGELYRVVLAGIRGSEVQAVVQKIEKAGFHEAIIREE